MAEFIILNYFKSWEKVTPYTGEALIVLLIVIRFVF